MERRIFIGLAAASALAACDPMMAPQKKPDLVDLAAQDPDLSTLVGAIQAAGLAEALKGKGPYTLFAPTNAAFARLPKGTLANLMKPENKAKLAAILSYHVVPGRGTSGYLAGKVMDVVTVEGQKLHVDARGGKLMVNDAVVTKLDLTASNGVIHIINKVLMPPKM